MSDNAIDEGRRIGRGMWMAFWLLVLGMLWYFFNGYLDQRENPNRQLEVRSENGVQELVLRRNSLGHYVLPGTINGRAVVFLLDTGATHVSVPAHLGAELGLAPGARMTSQTANGTVEVRATRIDTLGIGPFLLHDISASLNPGMGDNEVLLGMSALKRFEFTQRDNNLILRAPLTR